MNRRPIAQLLTVAIAMAAGTTLAATPTAETIVQRSIAAAGSETALASYDVIRAAIHEEETTSDGKTKATDVTVLFDGGRLENIRLEIGSGISIVLNGSTGWATIRGELDTRPTAARMAAGTVRQRIFPLLFPYSLQLDGLRFETVGEGSFDRKPAWVIDVTFSPEFFASPSMSTTWQVFFDKENYQVLGAQYSLPPEYRLNRGEGVRYRVLTRSTTNELTLATQVLLDGVDANGLEDGHVRVTKISYTPIGSFDRSVFMNPEELAKHDAGDVE